MERSRSTIWGKVLIAVLACAVGYFFGLLNGEIRNDNMRADELIREIEPILADDPKFSDVRVGVISPVRRLRGVLQLGLGDTLRSGESAGGLCV